MWSLDRSWPETRLSGREVSAAAIALPRTADAVVLGFADGTLRYSRADGKSQLMTKAEVAREISAVTALAVTPDGLHLTSAESNGNVRVWNLSQLLERLPEGAMPGRPVDMSPDGRFVMFLSDGETIVRDTLGGTDTGICRGPDTFPRKRFIRRPLGRIIACDARSIRDGGGMGQLERRILARLPTQLQHCALMSRRQQIVYLTPSNRVSIFDVQSGQHVECAGVPGSDVCFIAAIPGTDQFVVGRSESLSLYDAGNPRSGEKIIRLEEALDPDRRWQATICGHAMLLRAYDRAEVWDLETGVNSRIQANPSMVRC